MRSETLSSADYNYPHALRDTEVAGAQYQIAVAQMSSRYGPGPFRTLTVSI